MDADERSWLGDPAADVRRARVPQTAAAFAARAHGARPLPVACAKILTLTATDRFELADLVSALEADPPMSARVLRLVNSAAFGLRARCGSVRHAVSLLGGRGVRSAVLAGAVLQIFPGRERREWHALHEHASRVATLARYLAPEWRLPAEEMFTAAFLHDIGMWVLLDLEPDYAAVLAEHGASPDGTVDDERGRFGFDHAELGEHMLTEWNIPQPIPRLVGLHHDPAEAYASRPEIALRVAVLRLANLLGHAMAPGAEAVDFDALAASEPLNYLGISAAAMADRFAFLRDQLAGRAGRSAALALSPSPATRSAVAPPAEVCSRCDGVSFGVRCGRCDARLCDVHAPGRGRLCDDCERDFAGRVNGTLTTRPLVTLTAAGAGVACAAALAGAGGATWSAVPAVLGLGLGVFGAWQRWLLRREFVRLRDSTPPAT